MFNLNFYLSSASFLISLGGGIYFFVWWLRSRMRHTVTLYWAAGLGLLLWFKIPNILANAGLVIMQQNFYRFFFVTLLMYLAAYIALMRGLAFLSKRGRSALAAGFSAVWLYIAVVYFSFSFFIPGFELTYTPVWASHVFFYIPAQLFVLYELWWVKKMPNAPLVSHRVNLLINFGVLLFLASSLLYIFVQAWAFPIEFWYISAISSPRISFLQVAGSICLFLGLRSLTKAYLLNTK